MTEWHILTGEYPPDPGGVSDHSRLIAHGLAKAGQTVHVWAPNLSALEQDRGSKTEDRSDARESMKTETLRTPPSIFYPLSSILYHPLPDRFGRRSLEQLDDSLKKTASNRLLLVQYVPHAFGRKGMNLPFCWWLFRHRRQERIWVMFHEVAFPLRFRQSLKHNLLGGVTRLMAALTAQAAERCFVSTASWIPLLRRWTSAQKPIDCLPVSSNLPENVPPDAVLRARQKFVHEASQKLIGCLVANPRAFPLVEKVFSSLLAENSGRIGLLLGRESANLSAALRQELAPRLFGTGELTPFNLAAHLAACDLLIQPFPDGVSTRRTSLMAGLALGVPVVTTRGFLTEPFWQKTGYVALGPADSPQALAELAAKLLSDPAQRRMLGDRGQAGYREHFSLEKTIGTLLATKAMRGQGDAATRRHTETRRNRQVSVSPCLRVAESPSVLRPLRILVAHNVSRRRNGGMSRLMGFVHDRVAAAGHEVDFLCTEDVPAALNGRKARLTFPWLVLQKALTAAAKNQPYDVINIHEPSAVALLAARRAAGHPSVVLTSYGIEKRGWQLSLAETSLGHEGPSFKSRLIFPLTSLWQSTLGLRRADHILCSNQEDAAYVRREFDVPDSKITCIYPGADPLYAKLAADRDYSRSDRMLFAATWIKRKGINDLVPALIALASRGFAWNLTVLGAGMPEEVVLGRFPDELRNRVRCVQSNNEAENAVVFAAADIYLLPSLFEGTPLTLIEAMMSGLPIVTTATCGMKDVIQDGRNGLLVPAHSPSAIVQTVERLTSQPSLRAALGRQAQADALRKFTWECAAEPIFGVYERLGARRKFVAERP